MKRRIFSRFYVSTRLFLINVLVFVCVMLGIVVIFSSFSRIEQTMTDIVQRDVTRVITNASIGRALTELFAETATLVGRITEKKAWIENQRARLEQGLRGIVSQTEPGSALNETLTQFLIAFQTLLDESLLLNEQLDKLSHTDRALDEALSKLEEKIDNVIIIQEMDGEAPLELERFVREFSCLRETRLQVKISLASIVQTFLRIALAKEKEEAEETILESLILLDELDVRLQELTGVPPEIAEPANALLETVRGYKSGVNALYRKLLIFQERLVELNNAQLTILSEMEASDVRINLTAMTMHKQISSSLLSLKTLILILAAVTVTVMIAGWLGMRWMLTPLFQLAQTAEQLAKGVLERPQILASTNTQQDEIGMLSRAFDKLLTYMQEMAAIAMDISQGNLSRAFQPRSQKDVLGHAFQNMSTYLQDLTASATLIAQGDLNQEVQPESEDDELGNAFHSMTVQLRENFEKIQQEVAERTRAQTALEQLNTELEQRVRERTAEITRQKYVLDTFLANVPDSIYFKDCESRLTHVNRALAVKIGLNEPAEAIGKTDFDFFPEEIARTRYEQEQTIVHTGEPMLDQEESNILGGWSLTTKMPLRDEHGHIIGTFGISRDITPLKHAQLDLSAAYEEIKILNSQLHEENLRMGAELGVARRLQEMVLPPAEELQQIIGLDIVGYMKPADEVGGDYYDVLLHDGVLYIGIGDVTGHGLESGVVMLMVQTAVRTLLDRGESNPKQFLTALNRVLYHNIQRIQAGRSLTFSLASYKDKRLHVTGQHEKILVIRKNGNVQRIETNRLGFPIGLVEDVGEFIAETSIALETGEGVILYTDGITEAQNMNKSFYGLERLCDVIGRHWDRPAEEIKTAVIADVMRYIGTQKIYDDITLIVLKQQ